MPTQVTINGVTTAEPGAYNEIDASSLDVPQPGSVGVVAVLGMAVGGTPYTEITSPDDELQTAKTSGQVKALFREGDLRELGVLAFRPSKDPKIPGGASKVVFVKVNPAAASTLTLENDDGDAIDLTTRDYGLFTTQTKVTVADGTDGGKKVTIVFEATTETFDNVGEDGKATLLYDGGSDGADTATVAVTSTAVICAFARLDNGQLSSFTQPTPGDTLEIISGNALDTTQTATVYGLNGSNVPTSVSVALNGTSVVAITGVWNLVTALVLDGAAAGTDTLRKASAGATITALLAAAVNAGRVALDIPVTGALAFVVDGTSTKKVVVRGLNAAGGSLAEVVTLTSGTPGTFSSAFAKLTSVEVGDFENARQLTLSGNMVNASFANYPTLKRLKDHIEAKSSDFTFTSIAPNPAEVVTTDLDTKDATSILTAATLFGILGDIVNLLNEQSLLVTAAKSESATGAPNNIGPLFLAGGHEGDSENPGVPTASNDDWLAAIDLLVHTHVDTIVEATDDDGVQAAVDAHCAYMCGIGRDERDSVHGAPANTSKATLKTLALALNSRHSALVGQEVLLRDTSGAKVWQPPYFEALLVACMQAGTSVGEPLTAKQIDVLGIRQHSSWNPIDNADEMIRAGLLIARKHPTRGTRIVRNNNTYLVTDNVVFFERSGNQAMNVATRTFRERMEAAVGKKGTPKTVNDAKALAAGVLDTMVKDGILVSYTQPALTLIADTLNVEDGFSPVLPINFVKIKHNVTAATITA